MARPASWATGNPPSLPSGCPRFGLIRRVMQQTSTGTRGSMEGRWRRSLRLEPLANPEGRLLTQEDSPRTRRHRRELGVGVVPARHLGRLYWFVRDIRSRGSNLSNCELDQASSWRIRLLAVTSPRTLRVAEPGDVTTQTTSVSKERRFYSTVLV